MAQAAGFTQEISSQTPVAAQFLANRALAHAQHLGNFLLRLPGFSHSVDVLTNLFMKKSVALLLHFFLNNATLSYSVVLNTLVYSLTD